ncbi:transporter [Thermopolyspora flexuosa]|uniref:LAO/AO transport system kinase n=1 Tax=Thermopolyspora flexuosa TaxID=103836 RepID=A0A543J1B2_9ACTN|nr:methylmalonyl Co-A mutase-associated GTPase MeaB [Thermopolyspora flexuosa]TQM76613.1 LAO/AO transport system kinase [Thermopolyspora flexuosa]GGM85507.1 transporter [Thermopolyspora flexuosa]
MADHVEELIAGTRAGRPRAVARLISLIERAAAEAAADSAASATLRRVMAGLATPGPDGREPYRARVIGLTGAPGVGKSTTTSMLVGELRRRGAKVGVLAVDPSSPFTGGALLGDRVRMQEHATDPGVFIRSMASRGHLGGLAWATPQALRVLDAAGCEVILVETVGVGQAEVDIAGLADTTVVLLAPGMGDGVQAAKAGVMEIGDVFVVNKADREGAQATIRELRGMLALGTAPWRPPIVATVASRGEGAADLLAALDKHHAYLAESGELARRRHARARDEIEQIAVASLRARIVRVHGDRRLDELAGRVLAGETDPYSAAAELVAGL